MINKIDLSKVPSKPGCYLWKDINDNVIYVGKSKNLKNRMKSYFNDNQTLKNSLLVKKINGFEYIVTQNDQESFLLETQLIHKYEPKYNIKVKFSGYSPYIVFSNDKEKLLSVQYKIKNSKNKSIYGPFPIEFSPFKIVEMFKELFPINKCQGPNKNIPCIYYQMNKCLGHCIRDVKEEEYDQYKKNINDFFKGKTKYIEDLLNQKILFYSEKLNFEKAKETQKLLGIIEKYKENKSLSFSNNLDADIFAWFDYENYLSISISYIRFGKFLSTENFIVKIYDSVEESVESFISLFYLEKIKPSILILMSKLNNLEVNNNIEYPKKGLKKIFLEQTKEDAVKRIKDQINSLKLKDQKYNLFLSFMELKLNVDFANYFELVDISSLNGTSQVGAVVAFKSGLPDKKMYRKYIIDSINYQDDYQSLSEVIYRHFRNKLLNNLPLPNVFVVDGGKGQINVAKEVLDNLNIDLNKLKLISLKKNSNHKTKSILFYDQNNNLEEINLDKIEQFGNIKDFFIMMQDEVHRFVINFNREKHKQSLFETSLDKLSFLNKKNINDLFNNFGTIHQIANANEDDLKKIIGNKKTDLLLKHFEN